MENKKVLLSIDDLKVQFHVRGRVLTAIRGVSLDIYENESIAIVGESGSGKSVFTKTFAGMLDSNGFIGNGNIIFNDEELSDTVVKKDSNSEKEIQHMTQKLNEYSKLEFGAVTYRQMLELEAEKKAKEVVSAEEKAAEEEELKELRHKKTECFNEKQLYDPKKEKDKIKACETKEKEYDALIKAKEKEFAGRDKARKDALAKDHAYLEAYNKKMAELKAKHEQEIKAEISKETMERNEILAKEIFLSVGRFSYSKRRKCINNLEKQFKKAMQMGVDLNDENQRNQVFDPVTFRVRYLDENEERYHGTCILNLAKIQDGKDWSQYSKIQCPP